METFLKGLQILMKASGLMILILIVLILMLNIAILVYSQGRIYLSEDLSQSPYQTEDIPVLVLGAGVINNQEPSDILKLRLDRAYDLYQANPKRKFIMSGDHLEDNYNEVAVMKEYLVKRGIPSSQIYLDHLGTSTYNSLYRLKHVFHIQRAILVSQDYHLARAVYIGRQLSMDVVGVPADELAKNRLKREGREILARIKDILTTSFGYTDQDLSRDYGFHLDQSGDSTNDKDSLE